QRPVVRGEPPGRSQGTFCRTKQRFFRHRSGDRHPYGSGDDRDFHGAGPVMTDLRQLPVSAVRTVGPQKAKDLAQLGIHTVADLLEHFPFRYEDLSPRNIYESRDGEKITVEGTIFSGPYLQRYGKNRSRMVC